LALIVGLLGSNQRFGAGSFRIRAVSLSDGLLGVILQTQTQVAPIFCWKTEPYGAK